MEHEVVLVDVTETPIQWPKKTALFLLWKKEKTHVKKPSCKGSEVLHDFRLFKESNVRFQNRSSRYRISGIA
ncbi:hypothetical protein BIY23_01245 [Wolbachia pipientis]|uniref:Uncharacterized protein n=1 Tax=Wolbachia pipientis TaxID=955 RepID=A0A1E7QKU1_WOLPI|nr:hypothetical protein BIY23_01245 [Wolbachia pipientis]